MEMPNSNNRSDMEAICSYAYSLGRKQGVNIALNVDIEEALEHEGIPKSTAIWSQVSTALERFYWSVINEMRHEDEPTQFEQFCDGIPITYLKHASAEYESGLQSAFSGFAITLAVDFVQRRDGDSDNLRDILGHNY